MEARVKGKFISFEGAEGSGKSTQIELLRRYLEKKGFEVVFVREPGGVKISEKIRKVLLDVNNTAMGTECETLLYMAARAQLVEEVIKPAIDSGKLVLCDRFLDSTVVYQGYGCGVDMSMIQTIGRYATQDYLPDVTLLFDIEAKVGLSRLSREKDRIEQRALAYHNRVRKGYLELAKENPGRIKVIKVDKSREDIHKIVVEHIEQVLN